MKFTCPVDSLLAACQAAQSATLPSHKSLQCLRLIAEDDKLVAEATDLDCGIRYEVRGVQVAKSGRIAISAGRMTEVLREMSGDVSVDADDVAATIKSGKSKFKLTLSDVATIPELAAIEGDGGHFEVSAGVLRTMVKRAGIAVSKGETGFATQGTHWEIRGDTLRVAATDTKRLAVCEAPIQVHGEMPAKGSIVPPKAVSILEKNSPDDSELVRVSLRPNEAIFQTERATITTRLIEGKFPSVDRFWPKSLPLSMTLPTEDFHAAMRQAMIAAGGEYRRTELKAESGKLAIASESEVGSSEGEVELRGDAGTELEVAIDCRYVLDFLRLAAGSATIKMQLTQTCHRVVLSFDDSFKYLVVPLA